MRWRSRWGMVVMGCLMSFWWSCVQTPDVASGQPAGNADSRYVYYPALPTQPHYQFLKTISSSADIQEKTSRFYDFVVGSDREKPIPIIKPYGMALDGDRLFVCDMKSGLIVMNLASGACTGWGLNPPGNLVRPVNLMIDRGRNEVYVADIGRKQVVVFSLDGSFLRAYGTEGTFDGPMDVALTADRVFVCDVHKHVIHVLDRQSGEKVAEIGKPGSGPDGLYHPTNIVIQDNRLYVSDTTNFRIQIFDLDGRPVDRFGSIGNRPGTFSRPKGIAVDREGRTYVVDAAFENVQVFDDQHRLLLFFLNPGNGPGQVNLPADVEISYTIPESLRALISPRFDPEYLLLVSSNFGANKVNIYAYGTYRAKP